MNICTALCGWSVCLCLRGICMLPNSTKLPGSLQWISKKPIEIQSKNKPLKLEPAEMQQSKTCQSQYTLTQHYWVISSQSHILSIWSTSKGCCEDKREKPMCNNIWNSSKEEQDKNVMNQWLTHWASSTNLNLCPSPITFQSRKLFKTGLTCHTNLPLGMPVC